MISLVFIAIVCQALEVRVDLVAHGVWVALIIPLLREIGSLGVGMGEVVKLRTNALSSISIRL